MNTACADGGYWMLQCAGCQVFLLAVSIISCIITLGGFFACFPIWWSLSMHWTMRHWPFWYTLSQPLCAAIWHHWHQGSVCGAVSHISHLLRESRLWSALQWLIWLYVLGTKVAYLVEHIKAWMKWQLFCKYFKIIFSLTKNCIVWLQFERMLFLRIHFTSSQH